MNGEEQLLCIFPQDMRALWTGTAKQFDQVQEIRLRIGRPVLVLTGDGEHYVKTDGTFTARKEEAYLINGQELEAILNYICHYSIYAFEDELKQGFITVPGGHRIGVAGQVVMEEAGNVRTLKHISYMNIRMAHQIKGAADKVLPYLYESGVFCNTLIISPPGCGKTTLLRDIIRQVSDGNAYAEGMTVGVVDERSEIAGSFMGSPQNDIGMRTDILDACPKVYGMMMLIRSMSPKVIAIDELGGREDADALRRAACSGCRLLATVHGEGMEELQQKESTASLLQERLFSRFVLMGKDNGRPVIKSIVREEAGTCFG